MCKCINIWTVSSLTVKAPNKICSRRHFNFLLLSFEEIRLDFSCESSALQRIHLKHQVLSAAAVIGTLRVNACVVEFDMCKCINIWTVPSLRYRAVEILKFWTCPSCICRWTSKLVQTLIYLSCKKLKWFSLIKKISFLSSVRRTSS